MMNVRAARVVMCNSVRSMTSKAVLRPSGCAAITSNTTLLPTCSHRTNNISRQQQRCAGHEVWGRTIEGKPEGVTRPVEHDADSAKAAILRIVRDFDRFPKDKESGGGGGAWCSRPVMLQSVRHAHRTPLDLHTLEERIVLVLNLFDKVVPEKLALDSHFVNDLGLDSLDHVEIIMAMEDEFMIEIPDGDAERLMTPREVFQYIADKEDIIE